MTWARLRRPVGRRGPGRVDLGVLDDLDGVVLDGGHDVPASPSLYLGGRRVVVLVDAEDDELGIRTDQVLERDLVRPRVLGRDGFAAGLGHHVRHERVLGRREDLAGRAVVADLVVDPRSGAGAGGRRMDGLHVGAHPVDDRVGGGWFAHRVADEVDVVIDAVDRRRVDDQDRDLELAELGDGLGRSTAQSAGQDEVGAKPDDLLDVDALVRRHVGQRLGLGRVVAAVVCRDDPVAGAERVDDLGVRGGQRHDLLGRGGQGDAGPLVIGDVEREGDGGRARAGTRGRRRDRSADAWRSGARRRRARRKAGPGTAAGRGDEKDGEGEGGGRPRARTNG